MYEPCGADDCPACFPGRASRKHYALGSLDAEDIDILNEQAAADEEAELAYQRMLEDADRYAEQAADDAQAESAHENLDEIEAMDTDIF